MSKSLEIGIKRLIFYEIAEKLPEDSSTNEVVTQYQRSPERGKLPLR